MNVVHFPSCTTAQRVGGVINPCMALSQPITAVQVGMKNTLCLWEINRQGLLKPCFKFC